MDFQYCIILQQGEDKGIKQYIWASEKQIKDAQDKIKKTMCYHTLKCVVCDRHLFLGCRKFFSERILLNRKLL